MKVIGVTGHSGSGKSTFAQLLSDTLVGSRFIRTDDLMYDSIRHYQRDFERIFGLSVSEKTGIMTFRQAGIEAGVCEWQEYLSVILPYMNSRINDVASDTSSPSNYIVVEWFHLPFTQAWNYSDCRILISAADNDMRHEKLLARMLNREQYRQYSREDLQRTIKMKDRLSDQSFNALKSCIVVKNNYDNTLQLEATRLAMVLTGQPS